MPKSLKHTDEVDTFDFGKAVTLVLSQVKELNKTRNTLVDDNIFLEARKKQESQEVERLISQKADVARLKAELTEKIIAQKNEFMADVTAKRQELAIKVADITAREVELTEEKAKNEQANQERQNELDIRADELEKADQTRLIRLKQKESELTDREIAVTKQSMANSEERTILEAEKAVVADQTTGLDDAIASQTSKKLELDNREAALAIKEADLDERRKNLASLAADLESQASLVESEKKKVAADGESIRSMQKTLSDKRLELDNREIHLRDRESIALTR